MTPLPSPLLSLVFLLSFSVVVYGAALPNDKRTSACDATEGISAARAQQVNDVFTSSGVIPDVVPGIEPKVDVQVDYNGKQVDLGNTFSTVGMSLLTPFRCQPHQAMDTTYSRSTHYVARTKFKDLR